MMILQLQYLERYNTDQVKKGTLAGIENLLLKSLTSSIEWFGLDIIDHDHDQHYRFSEPSASMKYDMRAFIWNRFTGELSLIHISEPTRP